MFPRSESNGLFRGLNYRARALDAQHKINASCFFVGTQTLSEQNQIYRLKFGPQFTEIKKLATYDHPYEIWDISCCPFDSNILLTVYNTIPLFKVSLWKIGCQNDFLEVAKLESPSLKGRIQKVGWSSLGNNRVFTLSKNSILTWDVNLLETIVDIGVSDSDSFVCGTWNPNQEDQFLVGGNKDIKIYDFKMKEAAITIPQAHSTYVRTLDFNQVDSFYFFSGGEDGIIKLWDSRNSEQPIFSYSRHNHWVSCIKCNPVNGSLVLSSGSLGIVNLVNISNIGNNKKPKEKLVKCFADHFESVNAISWGSKDFNPYVFISLSIDGGVIIIDINDNNNSDDNNGSENDGANNNSNLKNEII